MFLLTKKTPLEENILSFVLGMIAADAAVVYYKQNENTLLLQRLSYTMIDTQKNQIFTQWSGSSIIALCAMEAFVAYKQTYEPIEYLFSRFWDNINRASKNQFLDLKLNLSVESPVFYVAPSLEKGQITTINLKNKEPSFQSSCLFLAFPIAMCVIHMTLIERFAFTKKFTAIYHNTPISCYATFLLVETILELMKEDNIIFSFSRAVNSLTTIFQLGNDFSCAFHFSKLSDPLFFQIDSTTLRLTPDAVDTLEVLLWSLMNTPNYATAVLTIIALGGDSNSAATLTGGLATLLYKNKSIPPRWIKHIDQVKPISKLATQFYRSL